MLHTRFVFGGGGGGGGACFESGLKFLNKVFIKVIGNYLSFYVNGKIIRENWKLE